MAGFNKPCWQELFARWLLYVLLVILPSGVAHAQLPAVCFPALESADTESVETKKLHPQEKSSSTTATGTPSEPTSNNNKPAENEASGTQPVESNSSTDQQQGVLNKKAGVTVDETFLFDNLIRQALVYLPCRYRSKSNQKMPLVIMLHGARLSGKIAKVVTGFDQVACENDFVVAYPDALNKQWNDGRGFSYTPSYYVDDVHYILRLAKVLEYKYHIDAKRVYLVGYSSGGMLAQKIAMEAGNKIAGIAVVAATIPVPQYNMHISPGKPLPVVMILGTNDHAFPWHGGDTSIIGVKVGPVISVNKMLRYWLKVNGGVKHIQKKDDLASVVTNSNCALGNSEVEEISYMTEKETQVTLFKVNGGGHTWPGSKIPFTYIPFLGKQVKSLNAADVIWRTLSPYSR
jgi:polyhydroxybutyrate depolymerase